MKKTKFISSGKSKFLKKGLELMLTDEMIEIFTKKGYGSVAEEAVKKKTKPTIDNQ